MQDYSYTLDITYDCIFNEVDIFVVVFVPFEGILYGNFEWCLPTYEEIFCKCHLGNTLDEIFAREKKMGGRIMHVMIFFVY